MRRSRSFPAAPSITVAFSVPPYQNQQLEHPGIHTVLNSFDVLGGVAQLHRRLDEQAFHDANPKL